MPTLEAFADSLDLDVVETRSKGTYALQLDPAALRVQPGAYSSLASFGATSAEARASLLRQMTGRKLRLTADRGLGQMKALE